MSIQRFRMDFYIYSCCNVEKAITEIRKIYYLEQDYFKHFFKKHYIKNTFILNDSVKLYFNYQDSTEYTYMSFEGSFSNFESDIKTAYELYQKLCKCFPIRLKLYDFLNDSKHTITYLEFYNHVKSFYVSSKKTGDGSVS